MKKIGLLGGSFDPPHKGHLFISIEAKKILKLDEIWWLVTPQNPLIISQPATYKERVKNCKKITTNYPINNIKALNSISAKTFSNYRTSKIDLNKKIIKSIPLWTWINNKEVKISSTEIRNQRSFFRGKN